MPSVSELTEFEGQSRDYLNAFNSGDYEKVASYWTDDAVSCPPMGEEIRGRAAARATRGLTALRPSQFPRTCS